MLSQRKRFNYMVNSGRTNSSNKQTYNTSAIKSNFGAPREEPVIPSKFNEEKQNPKKIDQLEQINRKLIEETTRQFKKLESDVHRVQKILEQKQTALQQSKEQGSKLKQELSLVNEEKKILIEAIFQKDLVIKEYENRIKQLMQIQQSFSTPEKQKPAKAQMIQTEIQTEPEPDTCAKSQLTKALATNLQLEDELYRLKQQLFDASNKVKLIHQQFEAYKILKEIESIQSI